MTCNHIHRDIESVFVKFKPWCYPFSSYVFVSDYAVTKLGTCLHVSSYSVLALTS